MNNPNRPIIEAMPQALLKFLEKKELVNAYCNNMRNEISEEDAIEVLSTEDIDDLILGAFVWADTNEGGPFWNNIDDKYQDYLGGQNAD